MLQDAVVGGLLALGLAGYLYVGLMPFRFDFGRTPRVHLGFVAPLNSTLNFLCFIPLGFLIAVLSFVERPVLSAGLLCGGASLLVEFLQLFIPGRFSSFADLLLNTSGGVAGALLAVELAPRIHQAAVA